MTNLDFRQYLLNQLPEVLRQNPDLGLNLVEILFLFQLLKLLLNRLTRELPFIAEHFLFLVNVDPGLLEVACLFVDAAAITLLS